MCVYLCIKFQGCSIILTSFRQGVILPPFPPTSKLKSPPRLGLKYKKEKKHVKQLYIVK